jgi:hypothetical protein
MIIIGIYYSHRLVLKSNESEDLEKTMNISYKTCKSILFVCGVFSAFLLSGCGATEQTTQPPIQASECRSSEDTSCEDEAGPDRSYDPCRINKNLPVCKT